MSALDDIKAAAVEHGFEFQVQDEDFTLTTRRIGFQPIEHKHLIKVYVVDTTVVGVDRHRGFTQVTVLFQANGAFFRASKYGARNSNTITKRQVLHEIEHENVRTRAATRAKYEAERAERDRQKDLTTLVELTGQLPTAVESSDDAGVLLLETLRQMCIDTRVALEIVALICQPLGVVEKYLTAYRAEQDLMRKIGALRERLSER